MKSGFERTLGIAEQASARDAMLRDGEWRGDCPKCGGFMSGDDELPELSQCERCLHIVVGEDG